MPTVEQLERFLRQVDREFPQPLSARQELSAYARKLSEKATLCVAWEGDEILSMVAGYTDALPDTKAYIAVVATLPRAQGRGLAAAQVKAFIDICREKQIPAVHLYTAASNLPAIRMYHRLGFRELILADEPRPADRHLIYYLEVQGI